jgi:hypothetical protein
MGRPPARLISVTTLTSCLYSSGGFASGTSCAPEESSTSLSPAKYEPTLIADATTSATTTPPQPKPVA